MRRMCAASAGSCSISWASADMSERGSWQAARIRAALSGNSGSETSLSVYCGYWAPNADSWVQMDDFALVLKPSLVILAPGGFSKL